MRLLLLLALLGLVGCDPRPTAYGPDRGIGVRPLRPVPAARRPQPPTDLGVLPPGFSVAMFLPERQVRTVPVADVAKPVDPPAAEPELVQRIRQRPPPLLTTPEKEALWLSQWPRSASGGLLDRLREEDLIFYDEADMPKVYQVADQGQPRIQQVNDGQLTANNEFPWARPAGMTSGSNFRVIRFVKLSGPILWWRGQKNDGTFNGFRWEFQPGTLFGEMLFVTDKADNSDHLFELRTRVKGDDGRWRMNAFRPFPTEEDFHGALLARGLRWFDQDRGIVVRESINSGHQRNAFRDVAFSSPLPDLRPDVVREMLLATEFQPSNGKFWLAGDATVASPNIEDGLSIVPEKYVGHFVPVDNDSCMRCHQDAGKVVNLQGQERWRLRGDDAIFSFHPFSLGGGVGAPQFNPKLVAAGLLAHKDGMP